MPETFKRLFNANLLATRSAKWSFQLTSRERSTVARWVQTCADPRFRLETERSIQAMFLVDIFGSLLGYTSFAEHPTLKAWLFDSKATVSDRVHHLFALTPAERRTLDDHMQHAMIDYPLGEV